MAQKRMFSKHITGDELFVEMPLSSQALYFHLGMNADDDGFVQPKSVMRMIGAKEDDLRVLKAKEFIIQLPDSDNVVVITHWRVNNTLKTDRYKGTFYQEHLKMLDTSDNMTYVPKWNQNGSKMIPERSENLQNIDKNDGTTLEPQVSKRVSIGKVSQGKVVEVREQEPIPQTTDTYTKLFKIVEKKWGQFLPTTSRERMIEVLNRVKPTDDDLEQIVSQVNRDTFIIDRLNALFIKKQKNENTEKESTLRRELASLKKKMDACTVESEWHAMDKRYQEIRNELFKMGCKA